MHAARTIANWLRTHPWTARWALRLLPDVPVTITIPAIGRFRIRTRRNRSFWLRDPLAHEAIPLAALRVLVQPGDTVYDVGANIGLYTRVFVACFKAGRVVAFEPMTDNLAQLRENTAMGGVREKVTVLPYALADADGTQDLQVDDISSASAALTVVTGNRAAEGREHYRFPPKSEPVTCRRLDLVIAEEHLPPPDVIKVDIEGAEDLCLAGATDCLIHNSPRILVELHGADKARAVFDRLTAHGYHCAGNVGPHLAPSGYCRLDAALMERVTDHYDVHFLLASKNPADLPEKLEPFRP